MMKMMKSLFLLMLAGAALGEVQKRVYVGLTDPKLGGNAPNTEGLHHVILRRLGCRGLVRCGGSLLAGGWVITAAHCDCSELVAILNAHPEFTKKEVWDVAEKHLCCDNGERHDLMLLKLRNRKDPKQVPGFPTIQLPRRPCPAPGAPDAGQVVHFYGWKNARLDQCRHDQHLLEMFPFDADQLRVGNTRVVPCAAGAPNDCPAVQNYTYTLGSCICVQRKHVAANRGDSGGSLVWNNRLYGVLRSGDPCLIKAISQSEFMNICYKEYRDWIRRVITPSTSQKIRGAFKRIKNS